MDLRSEQEYMAAGFSGPHSSVLYRSALRVIYTCDALGFLLFAVKISPQTLFVSARDLFVEAGRGKLNNVLACQ